MEMKFFFIYLLYRNFRNFFKQVKTCLKIEKLVPNLHDKNKYVVHIKTLNQALIIT